MIVIGGTVAAVVAGSAFGAGPAFADTTSDLSGTVLDGTTPVADAGVQIEKYNETYGYWDSYASTTTAPDGTWSISSVSLTDGKYATFYSLGSSKQALYSQSQGWDGSVSLTGNVPDKLGTEFTVSGTTVSKTSFTESLVHNAGAAAVVLTNADTAGVLNGTVTGDSGTFQIYSGVDAQGRSVYGGFTNTVSGSDFTGTVTVGHIPAATFYGATVNSSGYNQEYVDPFPITVGATTNIGAIPLYDSSHDQVRVDSPGYITISGAAKVGTLLTANIPTTNATNVKYIWISSNGIVPGATAQTFAPTADLIGKQLYAVAILRAPGKSSRSIESQSASDVIAVGDPNQATVAISGKAKFGQTVRAAVTGATVADAKYAYQWYANGAVIAGADSSSYTIKKSQTGVNLVVSATSVAQGHSDAVIPSAAVAVAKDKVTLKATTDKTIKTSTKAKVKISLKAGNSEVTATGKIKVYYSSKKFKSVSVSSKSKNAKTVTLPKLSKGKHTIKVVFPASSHYASKTVTIKVSVSK